jgi:hypothetical protein
MIRILITSATFGALAIALVLGAGWFLVSPPESRWEPAVNTLALLAGITGIFAERWAASRERRHQALEALLREFARNRHVLADARFSPKNSPITSPLVYPRLVLSATDMTLVSGALHARADAPMFRLLHAWRDTVNEINHRLDLTESLTFTTTSIEELQRFDEALHHPDGYLHGARAQLEGLISHMSERYCGERWFRRECDVLDPQ